MLNKIMLIGNLGREPEMNYTPSGKPVAKFSLAVNRRTKSAAGERQEETTWFNVVVWDALAETCQKFLRKGSKVYIEGRITSRKYTDKDNVERTAWEVVASSMEMLDSKPAGESSAAGSYPDMGSDDVPF